MAYKRAADGVVSRGKTETDIAPNSGPTAPNPKGGKGPGGVTGKAMRAVGRNMARANNQKG